MAENTSLFKTVSKHLKGEILQLLTCFLYKQLFVKVQGLHPSTLFLYQAASLLSFKENLCSHEFGARDKKLATSNWKG